MALDDRMRYCNLTSGVSFFIKYFLKRNTPTSMEGCFFFLLAENYGVDDAVNPDGVATTLPDNPLTSPSRAVVRVYVEPSAD